MNVEAPEAWSRRTAVRPADAGLRIDRAAPDEAPSLRALHELSLVILSGEAYSPEQVQGLFSTLDTAPGSMLEAGRMFVARRHGFIVGSAGWEPRAIDGCRVAHLRSVFTHPLQTRQGVASSLIRVAEEDALGEGARRFSLAATTNAVPLYRRLGYGEEEPAELDLGGGLGFPVVLMARTVGSRATARSSRPRCCEELNA